MHRRVFLTLVLLATVILVFSISSAAMAADDITVMLNGRTIRFDNAPIVIDDVTMVEVRPFAEALGCSVKWYQNTQSVKLTNSRIGVVLKVDYDVMTISDMTGSDDGDLQQISLPVAPMAVDGSAFVPLRSVAEAFGTEIIWDDEEYTVKLSKNGYRYRDNDSFVEYTGNYGSGDHTFFFQNQSDWQLPNYGSGYCWTVSYAMLISDVTGELVTPVDVAEINERKGGSGSYCYHWDITKAFDVKFIPAIDENSPYYGGRDSNSGGTKLNCEDEYEVIEALKEAIDRNPAGVMVRYAAYPHTMVAVDYEGDTILFNEPMQISRSYEDESPKECVPFEETCVGKRGIGIEEITFIQALDVK